MARLESRCSTSRSVSLLPSIRVDEPMLSMVATRRSAACALKETLIYSGADLKSKRRRQGSATMETLTPERLSAVLGGAFRRYSKFWNIYLACMFCYS